MLLSSYFLVLYPVVLWVMPYGTQLKLCIDTKKANILVFPHGQHFITFWRSWCDSTNQQRSILKTLRPKHNGRHFTDDIFKCIFLNENMSIAIKISLKFVPKVPINNIPALVQIMAWRRPGDKPLSEPMIVSLLTNIRVIRPQWVKPIGATWRLQTPWRH